MACLQTISDGRKKMYIFFKLVLFALLFFLNVGVHAFSLTQTRDRFGILITLEVIYMCVGIVKH